MLWREEKRIEVEIYIGGADLHANVPAPVEVIYIRNALGQVSACEPGQVRDDPNGSWIRTENGLLPQM